MRKLKENIDLNQMRSYSSVFSSTSFSRLQQFDDYSFIDAKIKRYDVNKVDSGKIITYLDYIRYIYKVLQKEYRNEYIYKNTLINELLIAEYGVKDTLAINEFRVGNSIADIVMFNGASKAFEIKTELDSDKRLKNQIADYTKLFSECYIVTHETLAEKYLKKKSDLGIIILHDNNRSLKIEELKKAKKNTSIDPDTLIRSVRTNEYKNIVLAYFGKLPEMNSFTMFDVCHNLIKQIPSETLYKLFIDELKNRKSNTKILNSIQKELRQLALAMNFDERKYKQLFFKLDTPINISK